MIRKVFLIMSILSLIGLIFSIIEGNNKLIFASILLFISQVGLLYINKEK